MKKTLAVLIPTILFSLAGYLIASHVTLDMTEAQCVALQKEKIDFDLNTKKAIDSLKKAVEKKEPKDVAFHTSILEAQIALGHLNAIGLGECLAKKKS